jgi:hypothetical protein
MEMYDELKGGTYFLAVILVVALQAKINMKTSRFKETAR